MSNEDNKSAFDKKKPKKLMTAEQEIFEEIKDKLGGLSETVAEFENDEALFGTEVDSMRHHSYETKKSKVFKGQMPSVKLEKLLKKIDNEDFGTQDQL